MSMFASRRIDIGATPIVMQIGVLGLWSYRYRSAANRVKKINGTPRPKCSAHRNL